MTRGPAWLRRAGERRDSRRQFNRLRKGALPPDRQPDDRPHRDVRRQGPWGLEYHVPADECGGGADPFLVFVGSARKHHGARVFLAHTGLMRWAGKRTKGLARVLDSGVTPGGDWWILMERPAGRNLRDFVTEEGPLEASAALEHAASVARAIDDLHRNLLVHGHLTPENTVLADRGVIVTYHHLGWAIRPAKRREGDPAGKGFLAPESASRRASVTSRSDVFSLGMLLYFMVTGREPVREDGLGGLQKFRVGLKLEAKEDERSALAATCDLILACTHCVKWLRPSPRKVLRRIDRLRADTAPPAEQHHRTQEQETEPDPPAPAEPDEPFEEADEEGTEEDPPVATVAVAPAVPDVRDGRLRIEAARSDARSPGWPFHTHGMISGSPVVFADRIYLASMDGTLRALSLRGEQLWCFTDGAALHSAFLIDTDTVGVFSRSGTLQAVDLHSGETRWSSVIGDTTGSTPASHNGLLHVVGDRSTLVTVRTGGEPYVFRRPLGHDAARSSPVISGDSVAVGTAHGLLRLGSGERETAAEDVDFSGCAPLLNDGLLLLGGRRSDGDTGLYAFDAVTLEPLWPEPARTTGLVSARPAADDRKVYVGSEQGRVEAFLLSDGSPCWTSGIRCGFVQGGPALDGDSLYVGGRDRRLHALDLDGRERWSFQAKGWISGTPAVVDEVLYAGAADGCLYAVDASTGEGLLPPDEQIDVRMTL